MLFGLQRVRSDFCTWSDVSNILQNNLMDMIVHVGLSQVPFVQKGYKPLKLPAIDSKTPAYESFRKYCANPSDLVMEEPEFPQDMYSISL